MNKVDVNILLVEDEPTLQYVFEKQLKLLGYKSPDVAQNGIVAIKKATHRRFHLIFMDVRMPELDGVSATRRIRQAEKHTGGHTIIIGLTAFAHRERCLDAGMDDFLQKPVLLYQLEEILTKWVSTDQIETSLNTLELVSIEPSKFTQTHERLREIQQRIEDLRRRSGLD